MAGAKEGPRGLLNILRRVEVSELVCLSSS